MSAPEALLFLNDLQILVNSMTVEGSRRIDSLTLSPKKCEKRCWSQEFYFASVGPIFVKYAQNLFAISEGLEMTSLSELKEDGKDT